LGAVVVLLDELEELEELDELEELEVELGVLDEEELDVDEVELGVEDELEDKVELVDGADDELDDELGVWVELNELKMLDELAGLDVLDEDSVLEDFWAPGVAMMNTLIPRMIKTPTAATATFLLFKQHSCFRE